MKSFKQFNEDSYARKGLGTWATGKALELGLHGIKKGYQIGKTAVNAITSLKSNNSDQESLTKRQLLDKVKNLRRDKKIREVIANTDKGSIERAQGLSGVGNAKVLDPPPKYTGK
tara:strand:+ start:180 stop:524 length:345 start_codon:yes stop_codon:yes gene_type:complete